MRITFSMVMIVAATLASAAVIPRSNTSRLDGADTSYKGGREVEGRRRDDGRGHARDFLLAPDDADILQRGGDYDERDGDDDEAGEYMVVRVVSAPKQSRRHPRDFSHGAPRPQKRHNGENHGATPARRHPRDFTFPRRHEGREGDFQQHARRGLVGRIHPRQFRSVM